MAMGIERDALAQIHDEIERRRRWLDRVGERPLKRMVVVVDRAVDLLQGDTTPERYALAQQILADGPAVAIYVITSREGAGDDLPGVAGALASRVIYVEPQDAAECVARAVVDEILAEAV